MKVYQVVVKERVTYGYVEIKREYFKSLDAATQRSEVLRRSAHEISLDGRIEVTIETLVVSE